MALYNGTFLARFGILHVCSNNILFFSTSLDFFRAFHPHVSMEDLATMAQQWRCFLADVH